jgi:hypothetical protein
VESLKVKALSSSPRASKKKKRFRTDSKFFFEVLGIESRVLHIARQAPPLSYILSP